MSDQALETESQTEEPSVIKARKPKYIPERDREKYRFLMRRRRQSKLPHYPE